MLSAVRSLLSATTSFPLRTARPGSIVHHRARTCYNASECAQPMHMLQMAALDRARSTHATVEAAGRHMPAGLAIFFFFF